MTPPEQDDGQLLERLALAVHRLDVDWDRVSKECGDPKCNGDCRWVAEVREIVPQIIRRLMASL